jgi:hypothetical protein
MKAWALTKQLLRRVVPPFCANVNCTDYGARSLLIYITEPFRRSTNNRVHQNRWQVCALASLLGEFGYDVDVVDWYHLARVHLRGPYDLVIDHRPGLIDASARYARALAPSAQRVAYFTTSNPSWQNAAELRRIEDVHRRRGVWLRSRRRASPLAREDVESFDAIWFIGNEYNLSTYTAEFRLPPTQYLRNIGFDSPAVDARSRASTSFIFLGGRGQVHKGLDLLLEVFAGRPHLTLYVCGHFDTEADFCRVYRRELFETPNIVPVGFVHPEGSVFRDLVSRSGYLILPSCAEGQAGSVLTGMSVGLIPVVSRECGFDAGEVHLLPDCSLDAIATAVDRFGAQPSAWVEDEARRMREIARTRFGPENYRDSVRMALGALLKPKDIAAPTQTSQRRAGSPSLRGDGERP